MQIVVKRTYRIAFLKEIHSGLKYNKEKLTHFSKEKKLNRVQHLKEAKKKFRKKDDERLKKKNS